MNISARSAYLHVPFCRHRCGYCNFTLLAGRDDLMDAYLDAIELEMSRQLGYPQEMDTIFLGGGTPTHLPAQSLQRLLEIVGRWLPPAAGCEFSSEANPLDCTEERLQILQAAGVNRLSLGGQSFSDRKLKVLERDHSGTELRATLERCAGYFPNLSLDLIFAAPEEALAEWRRDVAAALQSPIQHLSTYGLTIERGSAFYGRSLRHDLVELDADLQVDMYELVIRMLTDAGWQHYEVSNFALPGHGCRHNQSYWLGEPWWAFGPGAASFLPDEYGAMTRRVNHQSTTQYIRRVLAGSTPVANSEALSLEDRVRERLVFGLRQMAGVPTSELDAMFGAPARPIFEPYWSNYIERGWLVQSDSNLRLTHRGLLISDSLWPDLLSSG